MRWRSSVGLPLKFLVERFRLHDVSKGVAIPYSVDGSGPGRIRTALKGQHRFLWDRGAKAIAYGAWLGRTEPTLFVCEGESDTWTLAFYGLRALGVPGSTPSVIDAAHLRDVSNLYVIQEADGGKGEKFVAIIGRRLRDIGFTGKVHVLEMPAGTKDPNELHQQAGPNKFGVAFDELVKRARLLDLATIPDLTRKDGIPPGFQLQADGVYRWQSTGEDEGEWVKICSPIEVCAFARNAGADWGRVLRFTDPDGGEHEWTMPMELLAGDSVALRERLFEAGAVIEPNKFARDGVTAYITTCQPAARATSVRTLGWHDHVFVLPDRVFGSQPSSGERVVYQGAPIEHVLRTAGSLEDWRKHIGKKCIGNSRLILCASAGFAGPLLELLGEESGGLHLIGRSSIGKTTALWVVGSIQGGGTIRGFMRQWRSTANGLEGVAAIHCDLTLPLDEISQVAPREAAEVAYLLANEQGKSRARRDGSGRPAAKWRLLFISTGEITLADKVAEDGRHRATAGQHIRVLDVPADTGHFGMFENLHGAKDGSAFSRELQRAAARSYGTPIRRFLEKITVDVAATTEWVRRKRDEILEELHIADADGQVARAAGRFALIATAGELATDFDLTGWDTGDAVAAAARCFEAWLDRRGSTGPAELEAGVAQVRRFFEAHGEARFEPWLGENSDRVTINRVGFRKSGVEGTAYFVLPEAFKTELCAGFDSRALAAELIKRGYLIPDEKSDRSSRSERIPALGGMTKRVYCFAPSIIEEIEFWESVDSTKLGPVADKRGCYVFSLKAAKGERPW